MNAQKGLAEILTTTTTSLSLSLSLHCLQEMVGQAIEAIQHSLACDDLSVLIVDEKQGILKPLSHPAEGDAAFDWDPGLLGWVVEHGQALRVDDVTCDPRCDAPMPGIRSALVVPVCDQNRVIAVICLASRQPGAFEAGDERLLVWAAQQIAITVENARLRHEMERRLEEVSALYQLAEQVGVSLDVQEVLESIVQSLKRAMQCRGCSIALLDAEKAVLEIRASAGIDEKWVQAFELQLGEGIAGKVAQDGMPIYAPDILACESFITFDPSVRSLLTVPLMLQQRIIGTLTIDSDQPDAFSKMDEHFLTIAAAQAAVAIEKARLYASLEQRAQNLAEAYTEIKRADRLKGEIVRNVSHELRMPLTFVKSYVDLLLEEHAGPLSDLQKHYLVIVAEKTNHVTRLVSDIVSFEQVDRTPCRREPVSLTDLAQQCLERYATLAGENGLFLIEAWPDDVPLALGDRDKLVQVFDHLVKNAIKFSPEGGRIVVSIEETETSIQVAISDEGIGIPQDQQTHIFERFYQVDGSARRRFGGAGLGLAIVKRIVDAHEGKIWVESMPGQGSTFYFSIPRYQPPQLA